MAGLEIHEAAATGDYDSLEEYLKHSKIDVNLKDIEWDDRTALHWACMKGYVECIRLLIEHGADGCARTDEESWTPAHFAAESGRQHALRALFAADIPIDRQNKYGDTPKRVAEIYGQHECVRYLTTAEEEQSKSRKKLGIDEDSDEILKHSKK
ncbi:ankyrin repeat domain-containing protein 66-like [Mytilus californianus]|uniref:ankyrin repeat domain-containing protein 66-like n=1 Tax=Mytilus californianus TaxID=6549 RepID=UPI002248026D|nr:ankyrin repeat domain-containing protein 66-like [Mytilus californianus]XP_052097765.1 ankyrin repeat domain-containing protein 66-like [Mytilus californianus]